MKIYGKNHNLVFDYDEDAFSLNGDKYFDIAVYLDDKVVFKLRFEREAKDKLYCEWLKFHKGRDNKKTFEIAYDLFMQNETYTVREWKKIKYVKFDPENKVFYVVD